jgi:uncharacterized membrane protein
MMAWPTILIGSVLVLIGAVGYLGAEPEHVSPTALIPAVVGVVLMLCGVLSFSDKRRKHAMHIAAAIGVIGFLGGFMPLIRQQMKGKDFDPLAPAARNGLLMSATCLVFVILCVLSFIDVRRARKDAAAQPPSATPPG